MLTQCDSARPRAFRYRAALLAGLAAMLLAGLPPAAQAVDAAPGTREAPATLAETGLYADPATLTVDPAHIAFAPQYPLWTDGAEKRRWMSLPPGSAVDAADADAWDFPVGTRFWKEFAFDGRKVETRYMERLADGNWLFATYAWDEDQRSAERVSDKGRRNGYPLAGGAAHAIPGIGDCRACHLSGPTAILGFSARQLATDDPGAAAGDGPNPVLAGLVARGVLAGLDPRIVTAEPPGGSRLERAALGYLHGNCGHCHNRAGPLARLGLDLRQSAVDPHAAPLATTLGQPLKSPPPGLAPGTVARIEPGHPERSAIPQRVASRWPMLQMPPLGTALADAEGVDLINRWIAEVEKGSAAAPEPEGSMQ